jgi:peroxiredoxin
MAIKPGDKAPAFALLDQDENKVRLGELKGRKVLADFDPENTRS